VVPFHEDKRRAFAPPVLKAIKNSQFAPGEMQQGPVSAWLTITFRLKKARMIRIFKRTDSI